LYLAAVAVQTFNGGQLAAQAPPATTANGHLEPSEFFAVRTAALRDSAGDNRFDVLAPERRFRAGIQALPDGRLRIEWPVLPGRAYQLTFKPSLLDSTWSASLPASRIVIPTSGAAETASFEDTPPAGQSRFYRVELAP
ncbi:MAG: hypothetical protein N2322_01230, partial [Terrimicrobiaceae bacterium]|nr:hypothetical protein [Terrimicrobiaceae bacterium]